MAVRTFQPGVQLSKHFNSSEFKCKCGCGRIMIDTNLIDTLEKLFVALKLSKINVISGFRCAKHDKKVGGAGKGSHVEGYAADVVCYYKNGTKVPSSIVALTLERMGHFGGIGVNCGGQPDANGNIHIDTKPRNWKGDEKISMSKTVCKSYFEYYSSFKAIVIDPDPNGLNVRSAPGTGKIVTTYKAGKVVAITATDATHTWGKTTQGWICLKSDYVRFGAQ